MHENDIGRKFRKVGIAEHRVFPVFCIFGLVKGGKYAVFKQEKLHDVGNVVGRGAAEDGNFFRGALFEGAALFKNILAVKRVGKYPRYLRFCKCAVGLSHFALPPFTESKKLTKEVPRYMNKPARRR